MTYIVVNENEIVKAERERPEFSAWEMISPAVDKVGIINGFVDHCLSLPRIPIQGKHNWKVWQEVPESEIKLITCFLDKKGQRVSHPKYSVSTKTVAIPIPAKQPEQTKSEQGERTKIVCYCGSLRVAMDAFKKAEYEAVINGEIALLPCCMFVDIQREYGVESDYKQKADEVHKRKIDICDEVFVLNVGGYIGESTRSEIQYAEKIGKPVKYLEPTHQR